MSINKPPSASSAPHHPARAAGLDFEAPRGALPYRHIVEACFAERIGKGGLSRAAYERALGEAGAALDRLRSQDRAGASIWRLAETRDDLHSIESHARRLRENFETVVVLGTGGSSLGGQTLVALAQDGFGIGAGAPRLHFLDNVDPAGFSGLFASPGLARTGFIAISKSGSTPETNVQLLTCFAALSAVLGEKAATHFTAIAEPGDNPIRRFAERHGIALLDHDPKIGGRFSVLSPVGLLPACVAGVDIASVRDGAAAVLQALRGAATPEDLAPAAGAAITIGLQRECATATTVLMPYLDRLAPFAMWFRQLWAESLGKDGKGMTPVRALGTVDQHSQLQLYLDGPADKMFTLVTAAQEGKGSPVDPALAQDPRLDYLAGRTMGDLLAAEQRATYDTLAAAGRPVRVLSLDRLDGRALGALLMHYMIETVIAADLLGVNPYDQPAVEDGKRRARAYLAARKA